MTGGAQDSGVLPDGCPACGALPIDWAGGANPHAFCATPAPAGWQDETTDWIAVAKAAGDHGIRYPSNQALIDFFNAIPTVPAEGGV